MITPRVPPVGRGAGEVEDVAGAPAQRFFLCLWAARGSLAVSRHWLAG